MQEWLRAQLADGFADFKGASLTGSIPVKEELINNLIARFLTQPGDGGSSGAAFDARRLAGFVKKATIHAEGGVVTLEIDVRI